MAQIATSQLAPLPTPEPKLPPPQCFDGSPENCRGFITQCTLIFQLQPSYFPTDSSKVAYIITLLTGKALDWASALWDKESPVTSGHHPQSNGQTERVNQEVEKMLKVPDKRQFPPGLKTVNVGRVRSQYLATTLPLICLLLNVDRTGTSCGSASHHSVYSPLPAFLAEGLCFPHSVHNQQKQANRYRRAGPSSLKGNKEYGYRPGIFLCGIL
ncbi:Retrotransposon-like protein 1 [Labeo rohita]|uniref:Retrotransposon-like protein 1 n=1 Tax=Labeo rohita TaxID=84645 RepID=A0ABQ8L9V3_LABRO|nr:Retrotransposon-like protein 1 [Labeo rohita]